MKEEKVKRRKWDAYSDEELLYLMIELGEKLAKEEYVRRRKRQIKEKLKRKHRKTREKILREEKIVIPDNLPPIPPSYREMNEAEGYPSGRIYAKRFGSYDMALYLAGLTDEIGGEPSFYELVEDVSSHTSFSRDFVARMLDGLDRGERTVKKKKRRKDSHETPQVEYISA